MATGVMTSIVSTAANPLFRMLNIGGQKYYYKHFSYDELLYETLINILHAYKDHKYNHGTCKTFNGIEIAADMLCFRNPPDPNKWIDYSNRARMKVRIQYNQMSRNIVVMCKKQYQLESFLNKFAKNNFNPASELTLIGSS